MKIGSGFLPRRDKNKERYGMRKYRFFLCKINIWKVELRIMRIWSKMGHQLLLQNIRKGKFMLKEDQAIPLKRISSFKSLQKET